MFTIPRFKEIINGQTKPIVIVKDVENFDFMRLMKEILLLDLAEILIIGNEFEILNACKKLKINETLLYGIIDPMNYYNLEKEVSLILNETPDFTRKQALKKIKNLDEFGQILLNCKEADLVIEPSQFS